MKKKLLSIVFLFLIAIVLQGCDALYYFTTRDPNATTTSVTQVNPITDSTTSKSVLSKTGENYLYVFVMIGLVIISIRAYIKDKKERKK